ncbi:DUF2917 domain-containing protein [Polaromonas sp.]|uniref:DUF2917 domain-containing protein n=1 Tax=Polaromonas sp. TaxID=1869339 RepID=UPI0025F9B4C6|nr:DUF2917 domain-containing protein [Polaromonas sp.]
MDHPMAYQDLPQIEHQSGDDAAPEANAGHAASKLPAPALSGYCKLEAGRALTLHARQAGVLRITRGRVWLTFNLTEKAAGARTGDHFLSRGESLQLACGEAVVMEAYGLGHATLAYYSWEPAASSHPVALVGSAGWRAGVLQPLADLRLALRLALGALGRLARGLAGGVVAAGAAALTGFATIFVAARARGDWAERAFNAQASDTRAHCSIH